MENTAMPAVAAISPRVHLANPAACAQEILSQAKQAATEGARLVVFPELALTGATCGDLFFQNLLIETARSELIKLAEETKSLSAVLVVGLPLEHEGRLYNVAAVIFKGKIQGIVPKVYPWGSGFETSLGSYIFNSAYEGNVGLAGRLLPKEALYSQEAKRGQHEGRWFSNGVDLDTTILIGGQDVPCSPYLLFDIGGLGNESPADMKAEDESPAKGSFEVEGLGDRSPQDESPEDKSPEDETPEGKNGAADGAPRSMVITLGNDYFFYALANPSILTCSEQRSTATAREIPGSSATCEVGREAPDDYASEIESAFRHIGTPQVLIANPHATPAMAAPLPLEAFVPDVARERDLSLVRAGAGEGESTTDCVMNGACHVIVPPALVDTRFEDDPQLQQSTLATDCVGEVGDTARPFKSATSAVELLEQDLLSQNLLSPQPFTTSDPKTRERISKEALSIQTRALAQRLKTTDIKKVVIGISGGLDSTLALLVCCNVFDELSLPRQDIHAISMPGLGTTHTTRSNAELLAQGLGVSYQEIPIAEAVAQHFADIGHDPRVQNAAYENAQARERTQILMDLANDVSGLVVGTGDMSEAALGWATFNGDHMSMYNVNAGVPKTLVRAIVETVASNLENEGDTRFENKKDTKSSLAATLRAILDTPISPELLPPSETDTIQQKTENVVGPYELHDFFLYHFVYLGEKPSELYEDACTAFPHMKQETILSWLRIFLQRFFSQQFKRSCAVDGPQVVEFSLSPRGGFELPSDAQVDLWLQELDATSA